MHNLRERFAYLGACIIMLGLTGCTPTIKVVAPDKPIVIDLNVKVEQEVNVRVQKDVEDLFKNKKDIF